MGNIFLCIIRTQVNTLNLGTLSHSYVKRCTSCGARQYTSSSSCRFCGGIVEEVDHTGAEDSAQAHDDRRARRAAHDANLATVRSYRAGGGGGGGDNTGNSSNYSHSIPIILAHDPQSNEIVRYVQDHRGALVRVGGYPCPDGRSLRTEHPEPLLGEGTRTAGAEGANKIDCEKLRRDLEYLPHTDDINMSQIREAVDNLADMVDPDRRLLANRKLLPPSPTSLISSEQASKGSGISDGLRLRSLGSGRMTESGAKIVPLDHHQQQIRPKHSKKDVVRSKIFTQQDLTHATEYARQLLSCPVCLSEYTAPLTLPCGHSMCMAHLGELSAISTSGSSSSDSSKCCASCPICREVIPECLVKLGRIIKRRADLAAAAAEEKKAGGGGGVDGRSTDARRDEHGRRVVILNNCSEADLLVDTMAQHAADDDDSSAISKEVMDKIGNEGIEKYVEMLQRLVEKEVTGSSSGMNVCAPCGSHIKTRRAKDKVC